MPRLSIGRFVNKVQRSHEAKLILMRLPQSPRKGLFRKDVFARNDERETWRPHKAKAE